MKTPSILADWQHFKAKTYSGGMNPEQEKQVYRAFMAGALCSMQNMIVATDDAEQQAIIHLDRMQQEIIGILDQQCAIIKTRN